MPWTNAVRNAFLDQYVNQASPSTISALWVSLHSGDPAGTGANELSGNGYARQDGTAAFPAAASGSCANNVTLTFGPASGTNWLQATYFGFNSASTSGTFYGGWTLTTPQTVAVPNTAAFASGSLVVTD